MPRYAARRLLGLVPAVLGVVLAIMLTVNLIPGDPIALMLGDNARPEQVAALHEFYGLDKPFPVRYAAYVWRLVQGDLGRSIRENRPVVDEVGDVWANTMVLTASAMTLALASGLVAGVLSATRPYGLIDSLVRVLSLLGLSMPVFWTGLVLMYFLSYYIPLFPVNGSGTWRHLVLPAITLAAPSGAMIARMTRSALLEVMGEDYIRTARAKGLSERLVTFRHALRSALIPIITLAGLQFGQMMGGSILTETVFGWPGLGRVMVRAIFARDYVLLQGAVLVFALAFMLINLVVDLSYAVVDPRIRYA